MLGKRKKKYLPKAFAIKNKPKQLNILLLWKKIIGIKYNKTIKMYL